MRDGRDENDVSSQGRSKNAGGLQVLEEAMNRFCPEPSGACGLAVTSISDFWPLDL